MYSNIDYFTYLRMTRKEDTKENFILYLMHLLHYTEKEAIKQAEIYYKNEKEK